MKKVLIVATREYTKIVRKLSFWLSTLAFPVLIGVVIFISTISAVTVEDKFTDFANSTQELVIMDDSGLINQAVYAQAYHFTTDKQSAIESVRKNELIAFVYYPQDILSTKQMELYTQDQGLFGGEAFSGLGQDILKQSIIAEIGNPEKIALYASPIQVNSTNYKDGETVDNTFMRMIVPGIAAIIYFISVFTSASYLLMSVAEEKENRMIETILSSLRPRELIGGKLIGLGAVSLTQLVILGAGALLILQVSQYQLPIDFKGVTVTPAQVLGSAFFIISGFLMMASIMIGVGSAMPNYRDAQSFSSVFIMLSVLPLYFITVLIAEPSGTIAQVTSYFPFTSPIILLFRNALGELSTLELVGGGSLVIIYVIVFFYISFKLFEFGSLEYNNRISFRGFVRSLRR